LPPQVTSALTGRPLSLTTLTVVQSPIKRAPFKMLGMARLASRDWYREFGA
jgi:hypothetical protein